MDSTYEGLYRLNTVQVPNAHMRTPGPPSVLQGKDFSLTTADQESMLFNIRPREPAKPLPSEVQQTQELFRMNPVTQEDLERLRSQTRFKHLDREQDITCSRLATVSRDALFLEDREMRLGEASRLNKWGTQ